MHLKYTNSMLTKLFVFLFIIACVSIVREVYNFADAFAKTLKYRPTLARRITLIISIAVFLTLIITGFGV